MDIQRIQEKINQELYVYSHHADLERQADQLTIAEIETALLDGEILEQYLDDVRGESCLILGFANETPIHIVCGWRGDKNSYYYSLYSEAA